MNIPAFLVYCAIVAVTPGPNTLMSLYLVPRAAPASGGSSPAAWPGFSSSAPCAAF